MKMSNITDKVVVITGAPRNFSQNMAQKLYLERGVRTESTQWFKKSRLTAARPSDLSPM